MAQMLHLELTKDATPLDRLAATVREGAAGLGILADVVEAPDPVDATLTLTSGLWVSVSVPFVSGPDPFVADFGMERAATVDFGIDGSRDPGPEFEQLLQLAFALLARVPGDAVLHYAYAEVWLARHAGQLTLNEDATIWPPDRLAQVPVPYTQAPLSFRTM